MTDSAIPSGLPPDGGHGWLIVGASFAVYMLSGGIFYSQGNKKLVKNLTFMEWWKWEPGVWQRNQRRNLNEDLHQKSIRCFLSCHRLAPCMFRFSVCMGTTELFIVTGQDFALLEMICLRQQVHTHDCRPTFLTGILYPEFVQAFGAGEAVTAWLCSILTGLCMLSGELIQLTHLTELYLLQIQIISCILFHALRHHHFSGHGSIAWLGRTELQTLLDIHVNHGAQESCIPAWKAFNLLLWRISTLILLPVSIYSLCEMLIWRFGIEMVAAGVEAEQLVAVLGGRENRH